MMKQSGRHQNNVKNSRGNNSRKKRVPMFPRKGLYKTIRKDASHRDSIDETTDSLILDAGKKEYRKRFGVRRAPGNKQRKKLIEKTKFMVEQNRSNQTHTHRNADKFDWKTIKKGKKEKSGFEKEQEVQKNHKRIQGEANIASL